MVFSYNIEETKKHAEKTRITIRVTQGSDMALKRNIKYQQNRLTLGRFYYILIEHYSSRSGESTKRKKKLEKSG